MQNLKKKSLRKPLFENAHLSCSVSAVILDDFSSAVTLKGIRKKLSWLPGILWSRLGVGMQKTKLKLAHAREKGFVDIF